MPNNSRQSLLAEAGAAYGTNPRLLDAINRREQSGTLDFIVNDWDSNAAAGHPSGGPFQFIEPTFNDFAARARKANPAAWQGVPFDWRNPKAQALAASWAMANGKGSHWSTYGKALKDAGGAKGPTSAPKTPGAAPAQQSYGLTAGPVGTTAASSLLDDDSFLRSYMERQTYAPPAPATQRSAGPAAPSGGMGTGKGVPARRKGETGQQYLDRILMGKFGLKHDRGNAQTTGGSHKGRGHYDGRATDFGDAKSTPAQLQAAENYLEANAEALGLKLSLYGDDEEGHGDHLHAETLRSMRNKNKIKEMP